MYWGFTPPYSRNGCFFPVPVRSWKGHASNFSNLPVGQTFRTQPGDQPSPLGSQCRSATDVAVTQNPYSRETPWKPVKRSATKEGQLETFT